MNFFKNILGQKNINNKTAINIKKINFNTDVGKIFAAISEYSEKSEVRYVGGCIRKILNNEEIDDIDLATNLKPDETINALKNNQINFYETGIDHGTITANINGKDFEITSLRRDVSTDGRHANVEFSESWYEDASRRDFTINSIYSDLNGNLYDPFNGKEDLEKKIIKFIGNAEKRIKEDYLRILRYIRFSLNYSNLTHQDSVKKIIKQNISGISKISSERLLSELKKIFNSNGILKLHSDKFSLEIIQIIFPQLKNLNILKKLNRYVENHNFQKDFILLIAILIIDDTDNCEYFLYKFKISNEDKKRIMFIKNFHSKPLEKNFFSEKNLWKVLYNDGKKSLMDLINFSILRSKKDDDKKLIKLKDFFNNQSPPVFPIKARELIGKYNLKEGRELGQKLKQIENLWIENDFKIQQKDIEKIVTT
tara:strand:- start:102 stop:1376 length:1275 start_codon:yes stop_codon:yes gene_type:complete